jgi:hypothetical protein
MKFINKALLLLLAILVRPVYLLLRFLMIAALFSPLLGLLAWLLPPADCKTILFLALGLLFILNLFGKALPPSHPTYWGNAQYSGWTGLSNFLIDRLINWIGVLKYSSFRSGPITMAYCMQEDPGGYKIDARAIRSLLEGGPDGLPLQPGDILLRGFDHFIDGAFINMAGNSGNDAQYYSHAALYVGELNEADRKQAASELKTATGNAGWTEASATQKEAVRNDPAYFQTGRQMVIHSMSRGVFVEDILTFTRCDYLCVIRLQGPLQKDSGPLARTLPGMAALSTLESAIHQQLQQHLPVNVTDVVTAARQAALSRIGSSYDFQFDDCRTFHRFSCSEFVYFCYKSVHGLIGLQLQRHALFKVLFARKSITPPDIYKTAKAGKFMRIVWRC